jgi:hypothetical protein
MKRCEIILPDALNGDSLEYWRKVGCTAKEALWRSITDLRTAYEMLHGIQTVIDVSSDTEIEIEVNEEGTFLKGNDELVNALDKSGFVYIKED